MALRNLRKSTETVTSNSLDLGQVKRYLEKEDNSNFTVNEWRNKVFTDARVRSKLKDLNYKVKIREDVELTRIGAQKTLQQKYNFKLSEDPISIGKDAIIFPATYSEERKRASGDSYTFDRMVAVKVWNRPGKELLESKKLIYEADPDLLDEVTNSSPSEFPSIWAAREMKFYEKLKSAGISVPTPLFSLKNILVMEMEVEPLHFYLSTTFANILKAMKGLYMLGMVWTNMTEKNLKNSGIIFDAGHVLPITHPMAMEKLFRNCQNIHLFCGGNKSVTTSRHPFKTPEEMFYNVTGFEYVPPKISPKLTRNGENNEQEIERKAERKSERSLHAATKLKN